jgi:tetratricopeptide (TPR) repeat protein
VSLASAAAYEVAALGERVDEVEAMLASGSFLEVVEHAGWLMREYPHHRPLRQLKIDALIAAGEIGAAATEVERLLLEVDADAPDLRHAEAKLLFMAQGVEPARRACARVDGVEAAAREMVVQNNKTANPTSALPSSRPGTARGPPPVSTDPSTVQCAELLLFLDAAARLRSAAQAEMDAGKPANAIARAADALALASESAPATAPLLVLMAAALARLGRHVEAIAVCDRGLALPGVSPSPPGVFFSPRVLFSNGPAPAAPGPRVLFSAAAAERERLLLRRAGCFLELNQPSRALADYRQAAAHAPTSAQAAAGVARAWAALQDQAGEAGGDLYAALGVEREASDEEVRRAFRAIALRCREKPGTLA